MYIIQKLVLKWSVWLLRAFSCQQNTDGQHRWQKSTETYYESLEFPLLLFQTFSCILCLRLHLDIYVY